MLNFVVITHFAWKLFWDTPTHTVRHAHTGPIAVAGPLKYSVITVHIFLNFPKLPLLDEIVNSIGRIDNLAKSHRKQEVAILKLMWRHGDLQVLRSSANFGNCTLAVAGPTSWNRLPVSVRPSTSLQTFKTQLKTHFHLIY